MYPQRFPHFLSDSGNVFVEDVERIAQIFDGSVKTHEIGRKADEILIISIDQIVHGRLQNLQVQA